MDRIEELIKRVNKLRGNGVNAVGSLVHIKDMTENSICEIVTKDGGVKQLIYGSDKVLCSYLESILSKEGGKKKYTVEIKTEDNKIHTLFSSGEDELSAMDKVVKEFEKTGRNIVDIKIKTTD